MTYETRTSEDPTHLDAFAECFQARTEFSA